MSMSPHAPRDSQSVWRHPCEENSDWGGPSGCASHPSEFNGSKPFDLTFSFTLPGPTTSHQWVWVLVWMDHSLKCQHVRHFFAMAGPVVECFFFFGGDLAADDNWVDVNERRIPLGIPKLGFQKIWNRCLFFWQIFGDMFFWGCLSCAASSSWRHGPNASTGLATALRPPASLGGALIKWCRRADLPS